MVQTKTPEDVIQTEESNFRVLGGALRHIVTVIAVAFSLFHIYTGGFRALVAYEQRGVHLTFVLTLIFLLFPYRKGRNTSWPDICLAVLSAAAGAYLVIDADGITDRIGVPILPDLIVGGAVVLLVLEATRRAVGSAIALLAGICLRSARAENVDLSTVPSRNSVQLTIYNSEDITLVRETRAVQYAV